MPEPGGIWPENADTVAAFLSIASQWRTTTVGGGMAPIGVIYIGLDYAAALAGLAAAGHAVTPQLWDGVRVMEEAARAALNGPDR